MAQPKRNLPVNGAALAAIRKVKNVTASDLANHLSGVGLTFSGPSVFNIESGHRDAPAEVLEEIAAYLRVPLDALLSCASCKQRWVESRKRAA